jgi:hypothetical protein
MTVIQTRCGYWDNLAIRLTGNPFYQCKYKENAKEYFGKPAFSPEVQHLAL